MKNMLRKTLALLLVLCMLPCCSIVSWAEPDPGDSVTVTDNDASFDSVTVTDNSAPAVSVESNSSTASVTVTNDVSVTNTSGGPATGVGVYAYGGNGTGATVDVGGQVSASSKDLPATGISIDTKGGESEINAGSVTAFSGGSNATGVYNYAGGGETEVTVKGKVDSSSTNSRADGVYVHAAQGESEIEVQGNVSANSGNDLAVGVLIEAFDGSGEVEINGDVTVDGADGFNNAGIAIESIGAANDSLGKVSVDGNVTSDSTGVFINHLSGKTIVSVGESVNADHAGIELYEVASDGNVDIFVQDTISGGDIGILMDKTTISPENVSITTWKIDTKTVDGEEHTVALDDGSGGLTTDEIYTNWLEINVAYLIKVEPTQESMITVEGDAIPDPKEKDHGTGLKVAYWGDDVIMKVNVPSGYKLTGAYGDKEKKLSLMQDASGNYYLTVPNGGGIWLSVGLEKLSSDDGGGSAGLPEKTSSRYANYAGKARNVTITFDRNGGHDRLKHTSPVVKKVPAGTWVAMVEEQMKDGSVFECWYTDDPDTKVSMPGQNFMATHDVTFIAKWVGEDLPYTPSDEDVALLSGFSLTPMEDVEIVDLVPVDGEALEVGSADGTEAAETEPDVTESEVDAATMSDALSALQAATEALQAAATAMTSANDTSVAADGEENTPAEKETATDDTASKVPVPEIAAESIGSGQALPATLVIDLGNGNKLEVPVNVSLSVSLGNPA